MISKTLYNDALAGIGLGFCRSHLCALAVLLTGDTITQELGCSRTLDSFVKRQPRMAAPPRRATSTHLLRSLSNVFCAMRLVSGLRSKARTLLFIPDFVIGGRPPRKSSKSISRNFFFNQDQNNSTGLRSGGACRHVV